MALKLASCEAVTETPAFAQSCATAPKMAFHVVSFVFVLFLDSSDSPSWSVVFVQDVATQVFNWEMAVWLEHRQSQPVEAEQDEPSQLPMQSDH